MAQGGLQLAQTVIPCSPPSEPPSITPSPDRSMGWGDCLLSPTTQ